jgi:hypothetical protein
MAMLDPAAYGHATADVRAVLGEVAFAAAWTEGQTLELEEAIALALEIEPTG